MRTMTRAMMILSIPCAANVLMWFTLFAHPSLGFRDNRTVLFVAVWLLGLVCAATGIMIVFATRKSRTAWSFGAYFAAVILLNVFAFIWSLGAVANAFS